MGGCESFGLTTYIFCAAFKSVTWYWATICGMSWLGIVGGLELRRLIMNYDNCELMTTINIDYSSKGGERIDLRSNSVEYLWVMHRSRRLVNLGYILSYYSKFNNFSLSTFLSDFKSRSFISFKSPRSRSSSFLIVQCGMRMQCDEPSIPLNESHLHGCYGSSCKNPRIEFTNAFRSEFIRSAVVAVVVVGGELHHKYLNPWGHLSEGDASNRQINLTKFFIKKIRNKKIRFMELLQTQRETFPDPSSCVIVGSRCSRDFSAMASGVTSKVICSGGETNWKTFLISGCTRARLMLSGHFMTAICAMILQTKLVPRRG